MAGSDGNDAAFPTPHPNAVSTDKPVTRIYTGRIASDDIANAMRDAEDMIKRMKQFDMAPEKEFPAAAAMDNQPDELSTEELAAYLLSAKEGIGNPKHDIIERAKRILNGIESLQGTHVARLNAEDTKALNETVESRELTAGLS